MARFPHVGRVRWALLVFLVLLGAARAWWPPSSWPRQPRLIVAGPPGRCLRLQFSPDSQVLLTGHDDGVVRLWSASTGEQQAAFAVGRDFLSTAEFSSDSKLLVVPGPDRRSLLLWDVARGRRHTIIREDDNPTFTLFAFSPDSRFLATTDIRGRLTVWTTDGREWAVLSQALPAWADAPYFRFFPDGKTLAFTRDNRTIRPWDLVTRQEGVAFSGMLASVSFSPDGTTLAVGDDRAVRLRDMRTGKEQTVLRGHKDQVVRTAFSPDGKLLATGGDGWDGLDEIILWDLPTGTALGTLNSFGGLSGPNDFAFSPDSKSLAVDPPTCLFDVTTRPARPVRALGSETGFWEFHELGFGHLIVLRRTAYVWWSPFNDRYRQNLKFSPDGRFLALGFSEQVTQDWLGDLMARLSGSRGKSAPVNQLKVLDAATRNEAGTLEDSDNWAFSPDGRTLVTIAPDRAIKFWDVPAGGRAGRFGGLAVLATVLLLTRRWRSGRARRGSCTAYLLPAE